MNGYWQKTVPKKSGTYWTADRDGIDCGLKVVSYLNGKLVFAGGEFYGDDGGMSWKGWWWSEPVEEPPPASKWKDVE